MPTYRVTLGGQTYRFEAADEAAMQEVVLGLQQQQAEQSEEEAEAKAVAENPHTRGWLADVGAAAVRGPLKAIQAAAGALDGLVPDGRINIGNGRPFIEGPGGTLSDLIVGKPKTTLEAGIDALGDPQTVAGNLTEGVTQFVTGYAVTRKIAAAAGIVKAGTAMTAVESTLAGAATAAVFFDGQSGNLGNLMAALPAPVVSDIGEFLATDEATPELEGRIKNGLADAVGGAAVEGIIGMIRAARAGRKMQDALAEEVPPEFTSAGGADGQADTIDLTPTEIEPTGTPATAENLRAATGKLVAQSDAVPGSVDALPAGPDLTLAPDDALPPAARQVGTDAEIEALMAKADELSLAGEADEAAATTAEAAAKAAEGVAAKAAAARQKPAATRPSERPEADLAADLKKRLGITDDLLTEIHGALQKGLPPEQLDSILDLNPNTVDWSAIKDAEDVVAILNGITRLAGEDVAKRAGYARVSIETTMKQAARLADSVGGGYDAAIAVLDRVRQLPAAVVLQRKLVTASATHLRDLAKKVFRGDGTAEDMIRLVEHTSRHAVLQAVARGTRAEIGRSMRVMRAGTKVSEMAEKMANARRLKIERQAKEAASGAKEAAGKIREKAGLRKKSDELAAKVNEAERTAEAAEAELAAWSKKKHDERVAAEGKAAYKAMQKAAKEARKAAKAAAKEKAKVDRELDKLAARNDRKFGGDPRKAAVNLEGDLGLQMAEVEEALTAMGLRADDVSRLAKVIAELDELDDVNAIARKSPFQKAQEVLTTYYINNILSGLPTLAVNVSSGFYSMIESAVGHFGNAALAVARGGDEFDRMVALKAVPATFASWGTALRLAGKAWQEGLPQTDILARHEVEMRSGHPTSLVGKILNTPSRAIVTIDEFFKQVFYQQEITARAVEVAAAAARLQPKGALRDKTFQKVFRETLESPPDDLQLDAINKAREWTYQDNPENKLAQLLMTGTNTVPALRLLVPFVKTPWNIVARSIERSPLAFASSRWRAAISGKLGKRAQNDAILRFTIGTAAVGTVWTYAAEGKITGSRVGGTGLRNTADMEAPPYSIKIGDTWYQYNRLDPIGTVIGLTADLRLYSNARRELLDNGLVADDPEAADMAGAIMGMLVENLADKTFFKGLTDFFDAIGQTRGEGGNGQFLLNYASNIGLNFVPFSSLGRNTARVMDETLREAWTFGEKVRALTPGFSDTLPPRRDLLGREIKHLDRLGADWVSPFALSKEDPDPVARELAALDMPYRMPPKDIAGVKMTPAQYSKVLEVRGGIVREAVQQMIDSGQWASMPRLTRIEALRRVFSAATAAGEGVVMGEDDALGAAVFAARAEKAAANSGQIQ